VPGTLSRMDTFSGPCVSDEIPDVDLDLVLDLDPNEDVMALDCDPDFNSFLRELAEVRNGRPVSAHRGDDD
jgi:hypothetical protein